MRTRSSRFFVVLLHLVGVSHVPSWWWVSDRSGSGIVAVSPWPVALESIDLYQHYHSPPAISDTNDRAISAGEKRKGRRRSGTAGADISSGSPKRTALLEEDENDEQQPPVWLQDSADGSCLGPTGTFSECGDATLWFVERVELPNLDRRNNKDTTLKLLAGVGGGMSLLFGAHHKQSPSVTTTTTTGLVFRVADRDASSGPPAAHSSSGNVDSPAVVETWRQRRKRHRQAECLNVDSKDRSVNIRSCRHRGNFLWPFKVRSTVWVVNEVGVLQPAAASQRTTNGTSSPLCLARGSGSQAILVHCPEHEPVRFLFLRYRAVAVSASAAGSGTLTAVEVKQTAAASISSESRTCKGCSMGPEAIVTAFHPSPSGSPSDSLPVNRDRAHSHASDTSMHPELKLASRLLFQDQKKAPTKNKMTSPFGGVLSDTNPILLAGGSCSKKKKGLTTPPPSGSHSFPTKDDIASSKVRRIQTHPYIDQAKNEIWTDPQTGLQYHTDLCKYLGRDRKEFGRHTLTGVGIYRKGFVIKVYGIAYYVSKRDVLADPSFEPFASMTVDQLRARHDFYEILRKMGNMEQGRERVFDRTIMLKTNMQLSAETMRSSLQADWSHLTEEGKNTLVGSSMKPRPADSDMLALIQSPDNPSRCSCSQVAPPEYNANPECCARGTELVFTWTKANELEVRLNGRLMDTFTRPDIAEGIFYEYLRHDDPISPDLRDRVVDGFPFLLGPLAQLRGISIVQAPSQPKFPSPSNVVLNAMIVFRDLCTSQAMEMAAMAKRGAVHAADHAGQAGKLFGDAGMVFAREADRRRDLMVKHTVAAPATFMKLLARDEETIKSISGWVFGHPEKPEILEEKELSNFPTRRAPRGKVFGYPLSRWFGEDYHAPDEIGPMKIHPTINKIILALVHLYLLLLFIVSFPGSYSTRTKLIIRKSCSSRDISDDSESDTSEEENGKDCLAAITDIGQGGKKSLVRLGANGSRRYRNLLRTYNNSNELREVATPESALSLKKKSLSYFL